LFALHRFAFQQSAEQVAAHMSSRRCLQTAGRALWTMAFSFLLFLVSVSAAQARFSLQQIMSSPFPSQLVAAKTGGRVAWVFNLKGVRNVWISDATAFVARQVTHYSSDDGMPLTTLRLTPDGRTVLYVRGSATNSAGELANPTGNSKQPKQQVWAVDVDRGEPRLLGDMDCGQDGCEDIQVSPDGQSAVWITRHQLWIAPVSGVQPAHQLTYARGDNSNPQWSPGGKQIAFVSDRGDHSYVVIYDFERQLIRYMAPTVDRDFLPRWSPDGNQILFVRQLGLQQKLPLIPIRSAPWALWVGDPRTGDAREIWHSTNDENGSFPELTEKQSLHFAAGNRIIFASEQDGWNHLYSISAAGEQPVLLTPGQFDVEDAALSADRRSVLYTSNEGDIDRRHIWRVRAEGGKAQELTWGEGIQWNAVETGDGAHVLFLCSTGTIPAMPCRLTAKGPEIVAPEAIPADFPSAELITPKQVIFESEDGWSIHAQLFVAPGRSEPGPALVFVHGGPMRQMLLGFHPFWFYHNAYAVNQYLASLGYVVLSVNYRTGIMYGRAFREPKDGGWRGAAEYKDILAAGKYLQKMSIVDPKKIGLWGGSYGGFLTAMGLARNSDIFAAGVDLHGVHDWSALLPRRPGTPDGGEAAQLAFESSPEASTQNWKSPILIIHGDDDRNVPFTQSVDLVQRLRQSRVPFEQLVLPDETHVFLLWKSWIRASAATADFFDRVLKREEKIGVSPQYARLNLTPTDRAWQWLALPVKLFACSILLGIVVVFLLSYRNTITPEAIIIHHMNIPPDGQIRSPGKTQDFSGTRTFFWGRFYHAGYHYIVLPNGAVTQGRPERCKGAHTPGFGSCLGIALIGNFSAADNPGAERVPNMPSGEQLAALVRLSRRLLERYNIPLQNVLRHSDVNYRIQCPGDQFPFDVFLRQLGQDTPGICVGPKEA